MIMKNGKSILTFILATAIVIACTACGTNEDNSRDPETSEITSNIANDMESTETAQPTNNIELSNTYITQFGKINSVAYPSFAFNYSDDWTIVSEEVTPESERVEITNETGIILTYQYIVPAYAYGNMSVAMDVETLKVANSSFIPSFAQRTDYSDLGDFVVAKIQYTQSDSDYFYYAIMPESECGSRSKDGNFIAAFEYDGLLQFMAETSRPLTPEEEQEVIAILASFTPSEQKRVPSEKSKILTALQNGDFSYFAGTYERCAVYDDYYGGGEQLPNLILQDNGIVTGGLVFASYPETKPISVTLNEDGSYLCQVRYTSNAAQDYFIIYPQGVIGENPYIYNDPFLTETPYIHYFSFDGGALDIIYYEIED